MTRSQKTGMERLLRLREVQTAKARAEAHKCATAQREAELQSANAHRAIQSLTDARHASYRAETLDLGRHALLLASESLATEVWQEHEAVSQQRREEAEAASLDLLTRLKQRKAVEVRHQRLSVEIERALQSKQDAVMTDLWSNIEARSS